MAAIPSAGGGRPRHIPVEPDPWDARPGAGRARAGEERDSAREEEDEALPAPPGLMDLLDQARRVTMEGGFEPDRSLRLELRFSCVEPECGKLLDALEAEAPEGSTGAPGESGMVVTREGTRGRVTLRIEDPGSALGGMLTIEPGAREEN
jgi:hypothetical protein